MRVRRLCINSWRNLRDIDLELPPDASLVCLVGENGTGKSAVLEMLAACAHQLGIAQGVEMARGNPLSEPHDVLVEVQINPGAVDLPQHLAERLQALGQAWTGQLQLERSLTDSLLRAPEIADEDLARAVAASVVDSLRQRSETQHMYLDADRAYPPMEIQPYQYNDIWQQNWDDPNFTRMWAHRPTRTLYEEWLKYFIGLEQRASTEYITAIRRAREAGDQEPSFQDPFDSFKSAVGTVLPHLSFVGVESMGTSRTVLFDSVGQSLNFAHLSSGEREIAFLVGQIDRFQLRRGLLLIDEPELHLNPDLVRTWLAYLRETVDDGQVWIATHSLEAVEVTGPPNTFVFERELGTRLVRNPRTLAGRAVVAALSAAIGAPAFSVAQLRFVFIEGDRQGRERERFFAVCGEPAVNRFLEGGSCSEVLRRLGSVRILADETDENLHVGGVIDRDFRTAEEATRVAEEHGVHVLGCHEIENVFLDPTSLTILIERSALTLDPLTTVRAASDAHAGLWVAQAAAWSLHDQLSIPKRVMTVLSDQHFQRLTERWNDLEEASVAAFIDGNTEWRAALARALANYRELRDGDRLWAECLGKQSLGRVASALGLASVESLTRQVVKLWDDGITEPPTAVRALRGYVASLAVT